MSTRNLPEELIKDILRYVLYRNRASFETRNFVIRPEWTIDTSEAYHEALRSEQPGVHMPTLLVCKQWCRIGMPLLYECVVINSAAQLKTLATTLLDRPELARVIRRLRLAHAFGKDLVSVLSLTPNIHTLAISVLVSSKESVAGLRKALVNHRIAASPTRLLIQPLEYGKYNASISHLVASLVLFASQAQDLKRIDIAGTNAASLYATLLEETKGLEYLGVDFRVVVGMLLDSTSERLIKQPSFKNILCRDLSSGGQLNRLKEMYPGRVADAIVNEDNNPDLYVLY